MHRGARFVDVLDDALSAIGWEPPASEPRPRTVPHRPVVFTPLYNLHTLTLEPQNVSTAPLSQATDVTSGSARAVRRDVEPACSTSEPQRPRIDAKRHDTAPSLKRPAFEILPPSTTVPASPRRRLTAVQWRSLDAFNRLGAGIDADFSATDLRSAFRLLARRYHPDRHPAAGDGDRQRLSQQFTTLRTSYETLLTALDSPAA
jgi:hypothetical protein